jgi:hypothetical protein
VAPTIEVLLKNLDVFIANQFHESLETYAAESNLPNTDELVSELKFMLGSLIYSKTMKQGFSGKS